MKNIVCFGEVLWDVFPTHKKIGGAPLNVAVRLQSLENDVSIITRIGNDINGDEIVAFIKEKGINAANVQVDEILKTGGVKVTLDDTGSASYDITLPGAWDNIQLTGSSKQTTRTADAFIFGSLAARQETSKNTLYELLKLANYKIFDVNLRKPHYSPEVLLHLMSEADFIKFNEEELFEIAHILNPESLSLEQTVTYLAQRTNTESICITRGGKGAILYYEDTFYYNNGYEIDVVDTVGAGDSFLASLINKMLKGDAPQAALDFACAVGALVASSQGANPKIDNKTIEKMIGA